MWTAAPEARAEVARWRCSDIVAADGLRLRDHAVTMYDIVSRVSNHVLVLDPICSGHDYTITLRALPLQIPLVPLGWRGSPL